jgi:hypothetical protein
MAAAMQLLVVSCSITTASAQTAQAVEIINTSVPEISYVMEPFEDIDDEGWFLYAEGSVDAEKNLTISEDSLFGNGSLIVEFKYTVPPKTSPSNTEQTSSSNATPSANGTRIVVLDETTMMPMVPNNTINIATSPLPRLVFGWVQDLKPHNCKGATHLSLWYKVHTQTPNHGMYLKLTMLDDSQCTTPSGGLCRHKNHTGVNGEFLEAYSFAVPLLPPQQSLTDEDSRAEWTEVRIPVEDLVNDDSTKKNPLHLNRLLGWQITLEMMITAEGAAVNSYWEIPHGASKNKNSSHANEAYLNNLKDEDLADDGSNGAGIIVLQVDQLACIGGGDMLGAAFHLGDDISWEVAVDEGIWIEEFYNSELSYNKSNVVLQDGVFQIDYMVQMVESWGGFDGFSYLAPGPAYYNLTGATDLHLGYHTRVANSAPGRTLLRIVITDGSDCVGNCSIDFMESERWYSFHYILDENTTNDGWGEIYLPLVGSLDPATPLWLTGWSGQTGNSIFDIANIKGFTLEINIDSQGEVNSTASGAFDLFNMSALTVVYNETRVYIDSDTCVVEPDLYLMENSPLFQRKEFLGNKCCEICYEDETCLYALSTGRDCFIAAFIEADMVGLLNDEILQSDVTTFWMNDAAKRGDFCELCECRESDRTIDCRGRDLLIVPKTFYHDSEDVDWTPRVLDIRNNSKLILLGAGSLDSIASDLEELYLPKNMRHISRDSLDLPKLTLLQGDENFNGNVSNAITNSSEAFGDVCCSRGPSISSLTFCDMKITLPGIDSVYIDFLSYPDAALFQHRFPTSTFMSEAAENAEKCAEYCTISNECQYFSFDQRLPNAEHACYMLEDNGSGGEIVSRQRDNYADEAQTIPGYISGYPPRTRHAIDNARVLIGPRSLLTNPANQYETNFEVSLGSSPLRGAVWIYPKVASETELQVSFLPPRVVLYDANTTATVTVKVTGVVTNARAVSLVVNNEVYSCDVAYMQTTGAIANRDTTLFITVEMPESEERSSLALVIGVCAGLFGGLVLIILVYFEQKRKRNDSVWKVDPEEVIFSDPPEVLGRGTFGLVLKATYRGTDVSC